jgi:predicted RecA/RadA family phage recombinase
MTRTYIQPGDVMTLTAPAGGVVAGTPVLIGTLFVVPATTVAAGLPFDGHAAGVHTLAKTASEGALVEHQPVYWDVANARFSIDHTVGLPIGSMAAAALTADTSASVRLNGFALGGRMLTYRKRIPVGTINAGATLLPALPGIKYRLCDAFAIAIGGAVTSNTTADLKGTQASSVVKLVAFTQASLTQSTMVRAGGAGGTLLADGASFAQCDVNTPILIGNTGSAITVATNVDVEFTYSLE